MKDERTNGGLEEKVQGQKAKNRGKVTKRAPVMFE
jgi:hypothetical protein